MYKNIEELLLEFGEGFWDIIDPGGLLARSEYNMSLFKSKRIGFDARKSASGEIAHWINLIAKDIGVYVSAHEIREEIKKELRDCYSILPKSEYAINMLAEDVMSCLVVGHGDKNATIIVEVFVRRIDQYPELSDKGLALLSEHVLEKMGKFRSYNLDISSIMRPLGQLLISEVNIKKIPIEIRYSYSMPEPRQVDIVEILMALEKFGSAELRSGQEAVIQDIIRGNYIALDVYEVFREHGFTRALIHTTMNYMQDPLPAKLKELFLNEDIGFLRGNLELLDMIKSIKDDYIREKLLEAFRGGDKKAP